MSSQHEDTPPFSTMGGDKMATKWRQNGDKIGNEPTKA
jgi:hypothetical protein